MLPRSQLGRFLIGSTDIARLELLRSLPARFWQSTKGLKG